MSATDSTVKICRRCKREKPLEEYRVDHRKKDGYYATCKACIINRSDMRKMQRPPILVKICKACKQSKPNTAFGIDHHSRDGLRPSCKDCRKKEGHDYYAVLPQEKKDKRLQATAAWRVRNPEAYKASYMKSNRKKQYGIDVETYQRMLEAQDYRCAICKEEETARNNGEDVDSLSIDHDHSTGKVRGLPCNKCNRALGFLLDSLERVGSAERYLRKYSSNLSTKA